VKPDSLAPYGFGAELRVAVQQRHEALRRLGIRAGDPDRAVKLRELERRAVGKDRAGATGQGFLISAPDGFRGRVEVGSPGTAAGGYAFVSDGQRFVVLRATSAMRALSGREVTIERDPKGRLVVRTAVDRGIRR
jgi:hypothetical protein